MCSQITLELSLQTSEARRKLKAYGRYLKFNVILETKVEFTLLS